MRTRAVLVFVLPAPPVAGGAATRPDAAPPAKASAHARRCAAGAYRARLVAYDRADNGSHEAFARFRV